MKNNTILATVALVVMIGCGFMSSAFAGSVGHVTPLHPPAGIEYGYYTYLAPGEVMYSGDYMLAEEHLENGTPTEVLFINGDLQVWYYWNDVGHCDPTFACYPQWIMQAHTNTSGSGYLYNNGGTLQIIIGNNVVWQRGNGSSNLFAYQYNVMSNGCRGYATDFATFTLAGPPNYC